MAGFEVSFPDDLFDGLAELDDDEIKKMLTDSSVILEKHMKNNLKKNIKDGTGELVDSIKPRKPKKDKDGAWSVFVGPSGYSKEKTYLSNGKETTLSNAAKAIFMEYGTSKQAPRPFIQKTTNDATGDIVIELQKTFNKGGK